KYISGYGTPFDLQELQGHAGLDINNITHVRLVDVIGSVSGNSSLDALGRVINDPYPTNFPTGGFDLDAVAVLQQTAGINPVQTAEVEVYPNPATDLIQIRGDHDFEWTIKD